MSDEQQATCTVCGEPMQEAEKMFKIHGSLGPCPKPPLEKPSKVEQVARAIVEKQSWAWGMDFDICRDDDREHALEVAQAAIDAYEGKTT